MADGDKQGGPDGAEVPGGGPPAAPRALPPSADLTGGAGWLFATRVLALAGAAALLSLSVWLGHAAIRSGASLPAALAMFAGAFVLLGAGLTAAIVGVLGWAARAPGGADPLEVKAGDLGLPTDPEAYQDGGLAEACTARNLPEAETMTALLKASGVPAWTDAPLSSMYSDGYVRAYIRVLVPMGRLADAKELLAEHQPPRVPDQEVGPSDRGTRIITMVSVICLFGGMLAGIVAFVLASLLEVPEWVAFLGMALAPFGIVGLLLAGYRRSRARRP